MSARQACAAKWRLVTEMLDRDLHASRPGTPGAGLRPLNNAVSKYRSGHTISSWRPLFQLGHRLLVGDGEGAAERAVEIVGQRRLDAGVVRHGGAP